MQAQMHDCCEHGKLSFSAHKSGDMGTSQNANHHHASCGMGSTCAATASMAVLPSVNPALPVLACDLPNSIVSFSYTSVVSEGLQRPPTILA
jgi:hypothetical protein